MRVIERNFAPETLGSMARTFFRVQLVEKNAIFSTFPSAYRSISL
jgi:hypothetical protein